MTKSALIIFAIVFFQSLLSCTNSAQQAATTEKPTETWTVDFFDDFDTFNTDNWQDQRIWVNNEAQCYVPDGEFGTREVSNGTLKLKVINIGEKRTCDNMDKHGKQHPDTEYVAGRIASK